MKEHGVIKHEVRDNLGIVTLARSEKRNAMTPSMLDAAIAAVYSLTHDDTARVLMPTIGCTRTTQRYLRSMLTQECATSNK